MAKGNKGSAFQAKGKATKSLTPKAPAPNAMPMIPGAPMKPQPVPKKKLPQPRGKRGY